MKIIFMDTNLNKESVHESYTGILDQIHVRYDSLSTTERRIADWFLENANNATMLTISEIAGHCEVSEATLFRFCKQFGANGFREFRHILTRELAAQPVVRELNESHDDIDSSDDICLVAQKVVRANIESLYETLDKLDCNEIDKAVDALTAAKRINIYGEGSSGVIAEDAEYRLLRVGLPVQHFTSHMAFVTSALLTPEDSTIAISHSGRTREVVESQQIAQRAGAKTICITSFPGSPLADASDIKLVVTASQRLFAAESIPWRIVQLTIIDILCVRLWQHFGMKECQARAQKIDSALKLRRL
jgi:RpiR family transcriptional regulator, carbohydrate utilization regulator